MHFQNLTLENVGPFRGIHKVDFDSPEGKGIIVICGYGGTGKTSLLNSIEWALAAEETNRYSIFSHSPRNCEAPPGSDVSVVLRFRLSGMDYEISRKRVGAEGTCQHDILNIRVREPGDHDWKQVNSPEIYIQRKIPAEIRTALFSYDEPEMFWETRASPSGWIAIPEFRSWASARVEGVRVDGDIYGLSLLRTVLAGMYEGGAPGGTKELAGMQLRVLFREWLLVSEHLPANLQHLRGEALPWVLDSPFALLDLPCRQASAKLLSALGVQVIFAATPHGLEGPVESAVTPTLGRLHLIRMGDDYPRRGDPQVILGYSVNLSRRDGTNFSEIVSAGDGR